MACRVWHESLSLELTVHTVRTPYAHRASVPIRNLHMSATIRGIESRALTLNDSRDTWLSHWRMLQSGLRILRIQLRRIRSHARAGREPKRKGETS